MTKTVNVYCQPSQTEMVADVFEAIQNSAMGKYFDFKVHITYLTPPGQVVIEWPTEVQEFFDKQYSTKRPLKIPIIQQ